MKCLNDCSICPLFNCRVSQYNLRKHILSDIWFKNLYIYLKTLIPSKKFECVDRDLYIK